MAKFQMQPLVATEPFTARLGAGSGSANNLDDKEIGKIVKLAGESRYDLVAAGDPIEGFIAAVEDATADGFTIGSVDAGNGGGCKRVTFDGLQGTPGTGVVAVGDYVVAGTPVAKGTALSESARVCRATSQTPGAFAWRVVSLGSAGTGAVGTTGVIQRVNA